MNSLKALQRMYEHLDVEINEDDYAYKIADKDCDIIENHLKALEIIKEKPTSAYNCIMILKVRTSNLSYEDYCKLYITDLTQEEYDLLKEILL